MRTEAEVRRALELAEEGLGAMVRKGNMQDGPIQTGIVDTLSWMLGLPSILEETLSSVERKQRARRQ